MLLQDSVGTENRSFFNGLFGVSNITLDSNGSAGAIYPLVGTDPNDKILNGQIGDARGQYWGEDAGTTLGIVNVPLSQVTVYSYGQAINRTGSNSGITMFKHNTKNFFYIGDGGFVSNGILPQPSYVRLIMMLQPKTITKTIRRCRKWLYFSE